MATSEAPAVGIDLGTTYSVVAVYRKRKTEIIQNDAGDRTTPSYVAFTDEETYVGKAAKELPNSNTLFDSKRLLGRRYDDLEVQEDLPNWPFEVMNDGGVPKYEINKGGLTHMVSPEEVSAEILRAMKKTAEDSLENSVTKAVITVPAYFNDSQRTATINAGRLAGLDVIGILNEPAAAAIAFGFGKGKSCTVLIFDLGGGTFDVSVLKIEGDRFSILAHGGDTHLGGQDFDALLLNYVIQDIRDTLRVDVRNDDPATLHELRCAIELAKRKLSNMPQATISFFLSRHGKGYRKDITRATFEGLVAPALRKAVDMLPGVLREANSSSSNCQTYNPNEEDTTEEDTNEKDTCDYDINEEDEVYQREHNSRSSNSINEDIALPPLSHSVTTRDAQELPSCSTHQLDQKSINNSRDISKESVDEVVLVGGSTRIPKLRSMVQEFFNGKELNKSVNPDEAVAQGAAIHAAALTGQSGAKQVMMRDVTSLSLGVATSNGLVAVLIPRNTPLPVSVTKSFTTASDQQEEAEIKVCQGERARSEDNHVLGEVTLQVPARPKGDVDIDTTFSLDEGGVLTVTAKEKSSGEKVEVVIESEARLSERDLQDLLLKAKKFQVADDEAREEARQNRFKV